jgi:Tfp pilus assembly protein PilZ
VDTNYNQRGTGRYKYAAAIWHENILPGRFYKAVISDISGSGLSFESDQALYQGERIYIGSNRTESEKNISAHCAGVEIKWRKDLKDSSFRFCYGAEFLDPDNPLVKSIDKTKIVIQNSRGTSGRYKQDPREHIRELHRKEIFFSTNNRKYTGSITNISHGGAFITTKKKFALGQFILLDIGEDQTCKAVRLKGWVVRLSPNGVGVKFDRRIRRDRRKKVDRRIRRRTKKGQAGLKDKLGASPK